MTERLDRPPSRRLVLLGASNVRMSLATAVRTAGHFLGEPLDVMAAVGHGRSYGQITRVLGRRLTGITQCGLWSQLEHRESLPTNALLSDIGNDLLFGVAPVQLADWVRQCIERLLENESQIIITRLPLANFENLSPTRYRMFRSFLFPKNRHSLNAMKQLAIETDQRIMELSESHSVKIVEPRAEWYGLDPIHLKYRHWNTAYEVLFSSWCANPSEQPKQVTVLEHFRAARWRGETRTVFGRARHFRQPCCRLRDGSSISLF